MIKAVIFDLDGVIIDSFEANFAFFQDFAKHIGKQPPTRDEYKKMFSMTMMDVVHAIAKPDTDAELKKYFEMGKEYLDDHYPYELVKTPPEYEEIIELLSKKYTLGIVTSRFRDSVFKLPHVAKIKNYFKTIIGYEDTQKHKPDPEPLLVATKQLGVSPGESVYIGDSQGDMYAAKAAGMKAIAFPNPLEDSDAQTADFSQLPALISSF